MATVDRSQPPYYDDFDPSKQYTQILTVPARGAQAREFTQAQSILGYYLKRLSDTLLREGAIISGMGYRFDEENPNTLIVENGQVYLGGKIIDFFEQSVTLSKTGIELVGVKLNETIITEDEDPSLRDPASGVPNFGQAGAHRIKAEAVLTLNDSDAVTIYEFEDGNLKLEPTKPQLDGLMQILAKRTYDESGNYRVNGFDLFVEPYDADNVLLTVEAGLAYVLGYQVLKPTPTKIPIPMSKDTKEQLNEPKIYIDGTDQYVLNNFPAKQINDVVAIVEKTVNMTRGGVGDSIDYLPDTSIVEIIEVSDAIHGEYTQGVDYQLTADGVDWSLGGAEPNAGASYTVTYRYNKTMIEGTDYELYQETGLWGETKDYIKFLSGDRPVHNTQFTIDYEFYLARVDTISLDKDGNIHVTEGQPNIDRLVYPPSINDPSLLKLGTVYLPPASSNAIATGGTITRLDMEELQSMKQRLNDVEYNQAITALDREAMDGESPTDLKGIFSDSFRSTFKGDLSHPEFSVMYSLEDGLIMLPPVDLKDARPVINQATSDIHTWGRIITAPMREVIGINQPYATTSMQINPYLVFHTLGNLKLNPSFDNWIDTEHITIEQQTSVARNFYRWWKFSDLRSRVEDLFDDNIKLLNGQGVDTWRGNIGDTNVAIKTEKSTEIINEAITYMRQIEVELTAENLIPSSDNLECFFDGIRVPLTPLPGFSSGTLAGTVRANSSGVVKAKFTIPPNVRTGTREVVLRNNQQQATGTFTSIGTKRKVVDTIFTTRITLTIVDPLAQSFQFNEDRIMTSVGLYFSGKDPESNVVVQVRNVVNGYPSNIIYAEKVLTPDQINVSNDATAETKVTFDDPIYCRANTQYCIVLLADTALPSVYIAELGQKDITTNTPVNAQPYRDGALFSSKNAVTWTAHQTANLKFKVYVAEFEEEGVVEFEPIQNLGADRLLLLADFLTPQNTGCVWEMRLDNGPYQPITSYEDVDLMQPVDKVQLRATFKSDKNMSPLMAVDGFTFIGFLSAQNGSYISRQVEGFDQNIHNVKQVFEAFIPQGCNITPKFSYDDGDTWITPSLVSSKPVDGEFTQYTFEANVDDAENARKFRARIDISANSAVLRPKVRKFMNIIK